MDICDQYIIVNFLWRTVLISFVHVENLKKKKKQFLKTDLIVIYHFTMFTYTLHTFDKNCDAISYHIIVNVCVEKLVEHNMAKT